MSTICYLVDMISILISSDDGCQNWQAGGTVLTLQENHLEHNNLQKGPSCELTNSPEMAKTGSRDPSSSIVIFSLDTDVLVITVTHALSTKRFVELTPSRRVDVQILGKDKSKALAGFHAFTGCDTVGSQSVEEAMWKRFCRHPDPEPTKGSLIQHRLRANIYLQVKRSEPRTACVRPINGRVN
ncbi:hypothetical protein LOTGIDRAFT_166620 [Lottia gigantea]|uniref:Uncharacterized protein n=1 Tax=Lottia gigantea TaxID=225164 RepID=V4A2F0_LOTGI|nr:hypothetical protein LOTGIDRAFT_166620 [Lottia gigantea]ESO87466.1 hypothetical protein LOTGIDRAFT_166620 [Lottia gigantea]